MTRSFAVLRIAKKPFDAYNTNDLALAWIEVAATADALLAIAGGSQTPAKGWTPNESIFDFSATCGKERAGVQA